MVLGVPELRANVEKFTNMIAAGLDLFGESEVFVENTR